MAQIPVDGSIVVWVSTSIIALVTLFNKLVFKSDASEKVEEQLLSKFDGLKEELTKNITGLTTRVDVALVEQGGVNKLVTSCLGSLASKQEKLEEFIQDISNQQIVNTTVIKGFIKGCNDAQEKMGRVEKRLLGED